MIEGPSQSEAWQRVEETFRRYEVATLRLPLEDPEVCSYHQEYMGTLIAYRAILNHVLLSPPPPSSSDTPREC